MESQIFIEGFISTINFITIDLTTLILVLLSLVLIWFGIKFITKTLFKIGLFILLILIGLFTYWHLTNQNVFDTINKLYCSNTVNVVEDNVKCKCFTSVIIHDFESRFSVNEIDSIKTDPIKSMQEFYNSYLIKKVDMQSCFENNGESSGIIDDILNDIKEDVGSIFDKFFVKP